MLKNNPNFWKKRWTGKSRALNFHDEDSNKKEYVEEEVDDERIVVEIEMDRVVEFYFRGGEKFDVFGKKSDEKRGRKYIGVAICNSSRRKKLAACS